MNFDNTALPALGKSLNGFLIEGQLGRGGMGAVYRVTKNGAEYAMKVLPNSYHSDQFRFEREAIALAAFRHPNIVTIHSFHREAAWSFIIFEYVEGADLSSKIIPGQPWSLVDTVRLLSPLADALDAVHAQGIVHRDIKPANILIRQRDGAPLLTDFGIAKDHNLETMTRAGEVVGTIRYMAPEQFEGEAVSYQTDLWAFAQVLYEMITGGQQPFDGDNPVQLASSVLSREPKSPRDYNLELPAAIDQLNAKMFQKDPWKRHSTATALITDCERLLSGEELVRTTHSPFRYFHQGLIRRFGLKQAQFISGTIAIFSITVLIVIAYLAQESWQAHSWEQNTKEDIQTLGSKLTLAIQAAPQAFPEHLVSSSSALECCASIRSIQRDCKNLENSITAAARESTKLKRFKKFDEPLKKIKTRLKYLEWIHRLKTHEESAFSDIPKKDRLLAKALSLFRQEKYSEAQQAFESLSGSSKDWLKPVQLAVILSAHRAGNYEVTLQLLPNLTSDRSFDKHTAPIMISAHMDRCLAKLFQLRCSQTELSQYVQVICEFAKTRPTLFAEWNAKVHAKLSNWSTQRSKPVEAIVLRHRALTYEFPEIQPLQLNKKILKHCLNSAALRKDTPKSLMYFVRLRKLGVTMPIRDKFQLAFDSEDHFSASKLSKELALSLFLKSRDIARLLEYSLEAARNGIYLDALDNVEGRNLVYEGKFLDKSLKQSPFDPCLKFWQHYCVQHTFSRKELTENIEALDAILEHPQLPSFYKAIIYEDQAGKLFRRDYNAAGRALKDAQVTITERLNRALKLPHPRPDKVHWRYFEILLWSDQEHVTAIDKSSELFACLARYKSAIDDRLQRCRDNQLQSGRPAGVPLATDAEALLLSRVASYYEQRGKLYFRAGDFAKAERDLVISIEDITNSDTFAKLLVCIEKSKNVAALIKVERYVNIALSDPNRLQAHLTKLRALLPRIEAVKLICKAK